MASLDPAALEALKRLGNGDPTAGYRQLCAMAFVCSVCCQRWDAGSRCACSKEAGR